MANKNVLVGKTGVRVIMLSLVAGKTSKGRQVTKIVEMARIRIENAIKRVKGEDS